MSDSCVCMCEKWLLNHTEVGNHLFLTPSFTAQPRQLSILVFCHTEKLCLGKFSALLYRYKISVLSALCPDVLQQAGGNHCRNVHNVMSSLQQLLSLNHPHQHQQATFNLLLLAFFLVARRSVKTE